MTGSTLRLAWRNLWRNRRRTTLAVTAIGLSVVLVLAYDSVLRAYGDWMTETVTGPMLGHVQVHAPEWRKDRSMDRTLRDVTATLSALRRDPEVTDATARVYAPALAAVGEEGFAVVVVGVDPAAETHPMGLLAGAPALPAGRSVLVGRLLAEQMGLRVGDSLAVVGQGADGSLANDLYRVAGLVDTSVDFVNRQGVLMALGEAQTLFAMGDEAHELVVRGRDPARAGELASHLSALPALRGLEVLDWRTLSPEMVGLIELVGVAWLFVLVLVLVAAAAGVANTMLMSTHERTHELGMLLALGARPGRIVRMVVVEALMLGLVGALAGTGVGVALVAATHRTGVDYAALTGGGPQELSFGGLRWSLRLYPTLAVEDVLRVVAAVGLTSLVAAAWPAARVARLQPSKALRG
ncbi:ABC transporter permease [Anaeromyxobacter terrae]|uniref:ABC transporter permease n=1 Tax=Anaeromyxobacter terrae TaxID=2925406 RepID=UPI001F576932|nr:FtsX-like permease family protein [Anaeromyxobacter sp. SG22]